MKKSFVANRLKVSYHRNAKLSHVDFQNVNSCERMDKAFRLIWDSADFDIHESFYVMYFNSKFDVLGYRKIADGGLDAVLVDVRLIMSSALLCNATHLAVAHNHPSGHTKPSSDDIFVTKKINNAGRTLDIQLMDHIILTSKSYYSCKGEGHF